MRLDLTERSGPARELAYAKLREAILSARLEPGRKLSENELAGELGVSRTPVREALAALREERLVAIVPQLGTYVTQISDEGIADAQFVREALECAAIRLASERMDDVGIRELESILDGQRRAVEAADHTSFDRLDEELHRTICERSGRAIAWDLSRRANGHLDRVRRLSLPEPGFLGEMVAEHREIVDALAAHDADRAERAMRHHLRMVLSSIPALRAEHPEYFASGGQETDATTPTPESDE